MYAYMSFKNVYACDFKHFLITEKVLMNTVLSFFGNESALYNVKQLYK